MKKFLSILLILTMVATMTVAFASCGETKTADDTTAANVDETTAADVDETTAEEVEETTEEETTAAALTGEVSVMDGAVSVNIPDGWEAVEVKEDSIKIKQVGAGEYEFDNVTVELIRNWSNKTAEELADQQNGNYGNKGTISTVDINGVTYYKVSGVTDDDTQNMFITEYDADYYVEISVMYMALDDGMPVVNAVTINK